ncbi:MAG: DNA sulfur modification protein DndE [Peptococcaceae bacterium BRH_c4a]|nr:MAG: DNA sulfur modification protein DndE [Peptococcaceae bacterium BRH_c4a]
MIVRQVRLSNQAKNQLARLKFKTGIMNWNILCRWALCLSLNEPTIPPDIEIITDSNVEMNWHTFGGEYEEIYDALVRQRCIDDGLGIDPEVLAKYFKLHLHRGIAYLVTKDFVNSTSDLLRLAIE